MFIWTLTFLIIALLSALIGFSGIAGPADWIAKLILGVSLGLVLLTLVLNGRHTRHSTNTRQSHKR